MHLKRMEPLREILQGMNRSFTAALYLVVGPQAATVAVFFFSVSAAPPFRGPVLRSISHPYTIHAVFRVKRKWY